MINSSLISFDGNCVTVKEETVRAERNPFLAERFTVEDRRCPVSYTVPADSYSRFNQKIITNVKVSEVA